MTHVVDWSELTGVTTLFSVSSDKAANPTNIMGASKRVMEAIGFCGARDSFRTARFANVAFSDGSLPKSFLDRIARNQPIFAPSNVRRYFITHREEAMVCLVSAFCGIPNTIAVPKVSEELRPT